MDEPDLPPLMQTTPGITVKRFTVGPLGDEGEMTIGPDDANPFRSAEEREIVEAYRQKQRELREQQDDADRLVDVPLEDTPEDPTAGDDPFIFDDMRSELMHLQLPFANSDGPQF